MNAAELLSLSQKLSNHAIGYGDYAIAGQLREAAEVMELLAWAEGKNMDIYIEDGEVLIEHGLYGHRGETLLFTLRRAREASK